MPAPAESEVLPSLLLKVFQSAEVSLPLLALEAKGRLKVIVWPEPVTVKSEPTVDVAKATAPLLTAWPVGPIEVMRELTDGRHEPLTAKHPAVMFTPFDAEVVAVPSVNAPVIVVEALIVDEAEDTKPFESVSVVVVALPGKRYAKFA